MKYYAVAVVKKANTGFDLTSLEGKKSCHTGARRTAGWNVPIGYLLRTKIMPAVACGNEENDFMSASKFFNESCVPGKDIKISSPPLNGVDMTVDVIETTPGECFSRSFYIESEFNLRRFSTTCK